MVALLSLLATAWAWSGAGVVSKSMANSDASRASTTTQTIEGRLMGQASKLFNGNTDQTLIGRVTPTTEQREFPAAAMERPRRPLKRKLRKHGYTISHVASGSYKLRHAYRRFTSVKV